MKIISIGMNHETAPVELRECLAGEADSAGQALRAMRGIGSLQESFFLSTCNRVEALFTTEDPGPAAEAVVEFLARMGRVEEGVLRGHLYVLEDREAVGHVFSVASSLDSMVVGEPQILGQIKEAYFLATREKTSGVILNRLMHRAFHVAKRVRTETGICEAAVSISYAAVELAKKIFHELEGKKVLLIGAGEMAELAAKHLYRQGAQEIFVANRTLERAQQVAAPLGAKAVTLEEIDARLQDVDIVVASTAAAGYVITHAQVKACLRKRRNRPLFFIDIAVPRDVEPRVNTLDNVYVYDIDDLKGVIQFNMAQRRQEALKARAIVEEEVCKFEKWLKTLSVVPTIVSLQRKAETIVQTELRKSHSALEQLPEWQQEAVATLARSIAEKMLNDPILFLKGRADRKTVNDYLDVTRRLFNLDEERREFSVHNSDKGDDDGPERDDTNA